MKRIHQETLGDKTAKVYCHLRRDRFWVRLFINGKLNALADYHTGDKADAIETAFAMIRPNVEPTRLPYAGDRQPISTGFNVAVLHIASKVLPCGFDISINAPQNYSSIRAHYETTGRICVWNGASGKTIFNDCEVNFAFRAWHDSKHILHECSFTLAGEIAVLEYQKADIRAIYDGKTADYFCELLTAEIYGQAQYEERHGGFPIDQIGFARAYLVDAEAAITGDFGVSAMGT